MSTASQRVKQEELHLMQISNQVAKLPDSIHERIVELTTTLFADWLNRKGETNEGAK